MAMWAAIIVLMTQVSGTVAGDELVVDPAVPIAATIDGAAARLLVGSGQVDRLTLDEDYIAARKFKPATLMGKAEISVAGRREFKGFNRTFTLIVAGQSRKGRGYWFTGRPDRGADGSIGPWGLPQARITLTVNPARGGETLTSAPLYGDADSGSFTGVQIDGRAIAVSFDVASTEIHPVASAAAGAVIARMYGGTLSGPSWDVEVMMGVRRPVRLLTLSRPVGIGNFRFTQLAVRVLNAVDTSGRGRAIEDAGKPVDPAEVVVEGKAKGPKSLYEITIPRPALDGCSRITFDKPARQIELSCRPAT